MTAARRTPDRGWFKSTRSADNANCVEVQFTGGAVGVRDSKDRSGPALAFAGPAWSRFLAAMKSA